ncbi:MAG: hypothetical protein GX957_07975 [Clostridiaceae bacterium]|nr:hypothetical protein [Clostridiaceae bacterium]
MKAAIFKTRGIIKFSPKALSFIDWNFTIMEFKKKYVENMKENMKNT